MHEHVLREEYGYEGAHPYWPIADDVEDFPNVGILDPEFGFGGNGTGVTNCVTDGPFADLTLHMKEDRSIGEYCLSRHLNQTYLALGSISGINTCFAVQIYSSAWQCYGANPHQAGHDGMRGGIGTSILATQGM
ncbi:Amino acid transporter [Penicillium malachiteum]|uniref:Amino acid transporter n=1 Tax=Penicillium malachiteum TaxID=1324776 RepID=A0AAD6HTP2_9EURO|nr:Amino acid transporter [Penicillium malachiteum]